MTDLLNLTTTEIGWLVVITFTAGLVRGFSGFALSALVMATAILFLAPVEIIPIVFWLELVASLLMARGGWQEADRKVVFGLVAGSAIGTPFGLYLTTTLPVETSKMIALVLIITLALTQLAKIRLAFLATQPGLYLAGLFAGVVTGLASVGGMVVALYILSQNAPAAKMRAALVLFLFISSATSMVLLLWFDVMNMQATMRALVFALPTALGVYLGQRMFTPKLAPYYRPFCLSLLTGLATAGLLRVSLT